MIVDRDLENLLPEYLKNREEELKLLRTALDQKNFDELRQRGHRMKGVGSPYGFDKVTMLGKLIEDNALAIDIAKLENLISDYADFLGNLNIVYE